MELDVSRNFAAAIAMAIGSIGPRTCYWIHGSKCYEGNR